MMAEDSQKGDCMKNSWSELAKSTLGTPKRTTSYGDFVLIGNESPDSTEKVKL